jgi:murein DD-endopeptidase MepM/ murein hydrolase activator NlpD
VTREPALSIIVVPEDGGTSRTYRLSRGRVRLMVAGAAALVVVLALLVGSWWYLAARAARVETLETRLAELESEHVQVAELAQALDDVESRYARLRELFGSGESGASYLWLPPPNSGSSRPPGGSASEATPSAWPLADRGFVTQSLLDGDAGEHPGVDIAVAADTYVRAAGAATVAEVGDDPVYGNYVALDHGQGYSSLYAHASVTFVEVGQVVRRGEVIALSGNTGRSTAPHLHFEILREGEPVDPLTLVRPPA